MTREFVEREMTSAERSVLERRLEEEAQREELWPAKHVVLVLVIFTVSVLYEVFFFRQLLTRDRLVPFPGFVLSALAGLAFCTAGVSAFLLWAAWSWRRQEMSRLRDFHERRKPELERLLRERRVRAFRFEAVCGVFFEQFEDEGDLFVFEDAGGRCLVLEGQDIAPCYPDAEGWPGRTFELVETYDGSEFIGIFGDGQPLHVTARPREEAGWDITLGSPLELKSKWFDARLVDMPLGTCLASIERQA